MTFLERYQQESTWHGKVLVMEIYHLAMIQHDRKWTIAQTARDFQCSIGLVSENLRLANYIHSSPTILNCQSRKEALSKF